MESQIKKYGRTIKAIEETIKICKGKNILKEFCVTAIKKGLGLDLIKELVNLPEKDFEKIYPKALKLAA